MPLVSTWSTTFADVDFLLDGAALAGGNVAAVEAGGDDLVEAGIGQQVAGELFDEEAVKKACCR